eukprot:12163879-Heterocapsa_arctica.AAC.1
MSGTNSQTHVLWRPPVSRYASAPVSGQKMRCIPCALSSPPYLIMQCPVSCPLKSRTLVPDCWLG